MLKDGREYENSKVIETIRTMEDTGNCLHKGEDSCYFFLSTENLASLSKADMQEDSVICNKSLQDEQPTAKAVVRRRHRAEGIKNKKMK